MKSKCCNGVLHVVSDDNEGTSYYRCDVCLLSADPKPVDAGATCEHDIKGFWSKTVDGITTGVSKEHSPTCLFCHAVDEVAEKPWCEHIKLKDGFWIKQDESIPSLGFFILNSFSVP